MSSYSGVAVANVFLEKAFADKKDVNCMMLIGLVYSAHAWSLAKRDLELVSQPFVAWGGSCYVACPVAVDVYQEFKKFENNPVTEFGTDAAASAVTDPEDILFLGRVWDSYKHLSSYDFLLLEKGSTTPYHRCRAPDADVIVPNSIIKDYYSTLDADTQKRDMIPTLCVQPEKLLA